MNATFTLAQNQAELEERTIELLRLTYHVSVMTVCLTYLAGQQAYKAGRKTREFLHWVDESQIFSRPIWAVPMEIIDRAIADCKKPVETPVEEPEIEFEAKALLEAKSQDWLEALTVKELRKVAREQGIKQPHKFRKFELVEALSMH